MKNFLPAAALVVAAAVAFAVFVPEVAQAGPTVPTVTQREPRVWKGAATFENNVTFSGPPMNLSTGARLDAGLVVNSTSVFDGGVDFNFPAVFRQGFISDAGVVIGQQGGTLSAVIPGTETVDFGSTTITCADSTGSTVQGASVNDACVMGNPATLTAGGTGLHTIYQCYVSAANTVKIRKCAVGTAEDPGSVIFKFYILKF